MYSIDRSDQVVEAVDLPPPAAADPAPLLFASDTDTEILYFVSSAYLSANPDAAEIVTAKFSGCYALMFGLPNDEAMSGHPLAPRGLCSYGAFEVEHSSWVRSLEQMNRVHPRHDPGEYTNLRHFILTFHDTMFECVATGFSLRFDAPPAV